MEVIDFLTKMFQAEIYRVIKVTPPKTLYKIDSSKLYPRNFKNSRKPHGNICDGYSFQYSCGGLIEKLKLSKRNSTKDIFLELS